MGSGATIGAVLSNTLIAYGFSRIQWPGRNLLFYICVATIFGCGIRYFHMQ